MISGWETSEVRALDRIASVVLAVDRDDLFRKLLAATAGLECEQALFGTQDARPMLEPVQYVMSGYDRAFQQLYQENQWIAVDPTVAHCQHSTEVLYWDDMWTPRSYELMEESRRFRLGHGLSVAVHQSAHSKSMLSLARDKPFTPGEIQHVGAGIVTLVSCMHVSIQRLVMPDLYSGLIPSLTDKERQCLYWVAQGKSDGVIADIVNLSSAGVHYHVGKVLNKLCVSSRPQAAAKAVALGLLY